ncbi:transposase IS4 family protein [Halococcus saccharolyticus DSM 5350]|uniref:Transposase IS4 family protein n=2 Tax=Halococcus saccharolyticus TaxID=62319 RepID=M0ML49_9EURY|nr:transposase IS4 family protein [Halococcus saccharolyticus DSM 5350]
MFLAYLRSKVEDESLGTVQSRVEDDAELAEAFGFDPDDPPSPATFRPCRVKDRFEDLEHRLSSNADTIRDVAAERGASLGFNLGSTESESDDGDGEPSERTIQRLLRKKGRDVLDELKTVAIPSLSMPRPEDAIYEDDELLVMEAIAAIMDLAANDAGKAFADKKNPDPDLDDPFYEDGPSGETLLEAMKQMSIEKIATMMNFALRKTYTRAKPRLQELENDDGYRFGVRSKVALDITYVAYYGDRDELEWVQGTPTNKEYDWCHKFATAVIVGENTHYVVGVCPLGSTEYADTQAYARERSYYVGDVARRLLSIADDYVNIRMVYADREFHAADVLYTLEVERGLNYIIPAMKDQHRIGPMCDEFDELKRGDDEQNNVPLYVKEEHPIHGPVKHDVSNTKVYTNVVVLPPDNDDDDVNEEGSPQPFLTNLDVSDELPHERRWATKKMDEYDDRGAIENSYSSIKDAAAWTTSKEFEVRWFHFAFGCIIYDLWLLVDFLTQDRIGVIETRTKPRISLSRFREWLKRELVTLI